MFRKKAKGKDDPPAQPRVSDEYGEKLTRSLSMEIRELRIREKEILSQLKSRGVKADELSSDSEDGTDGLGRPGSPNEKRLLAAAPTSESLKRRASHGHLTGLAVGNDDDVLEDSQHGSGKALSAIQREESRQRERVNIIVIDLLFSAARGRLSACIRKAATLEAAGLYLTDLNCCDYDKRTPLHLSTAEGSFRVSEWLLKEKKVNPNAIDRFGNTPLQGAIWGDHKVIVNLLVEHGGQLLENGVLVDYKPLHAIGSFAGDLQSSEATTLCLEDEFWEISSDAVVKSEKLGAGEFGIVYRATWGKTPVAMKVLKHSDNLAIGEFVTEMNMMRKLHHPNLIQFLGAGTRSKPYFIVTEVAAGGSLSDFFATKKILPLTRLIELALDCANGMAYLHTAAIRKPAMLHRDLKPANLMIFGSPHQTLDKKADEERKWDLLLKSGTLKVTDFGLSKTLGDVAHKKKGESYMLTGETGSYRYMAPEVYRHEEYNEKVDVYAYAMILYQLFERQPPFVMLEPQQAAVAAALKGYRPKLKVLKKEGARRRLGELVERCWNGRPEERPDFDEIINVLNEISRDAHKEQQQVTKKWYQL